MTTQVFLSYSTKEHHFAELAKIKLAEAGITLWRDQGNLRAGGDWRNGIEQGISDSIAVLVALSQNSTSSSYVTFEWAYGLGKGKTIVPIRIEPCNVHPRIETIQYLDFSIAGSLPWNLLIERIREIEADATSQDDLETASIETNLSQLDAPVKLILSYLNQRGYQLVSFDRIRERVDSKLTNDMLNTIILKNPTIFKHATLKGEKLGLRKLVP
jgi:hypothetical protein